MPSTALRPAATDWSFVQVYIYYKFLFYSFLSLTFRSPAWALSALQSPLIQWRGIVYVNRSKNNIHLHTPGRTPRLRRRNKFYAVVHVPRDHLSPRSDVRPHSSTRTPYDNKPFIPTPCHPMMEESVLLSQEEFKIFRRFYHCSAQSNAQSKSPRHLHEAIFTQQQRLCLSLGVSESSMRDSRH